MDTFFLALFSLSLRMFVRKKLSQMVTIFSIDDFVLSIRHLHRHRNQVFDRFVYDVDGFVRESTDENQ